MSKIIYQENYDMIGRTDLSLHCHYRTVCYGNESGYDPYSDDGMELECLLNLFKLLYSFILTFFFPKPAAEVLTITGSISGSMFSFVLAAGREVTNKWCIASGSRRGDFLPARRTKYCGRAFTSPQQYQQGGGRMC
mmetsp:Transcript_27363/g.37601  ORF Transcript_27363/g.37601 Transcript_27363/m.37601 type:complete len:136 (-) Transcript_27363:120-527(-)